MIKFKFYIFSVIFITLCCSDTKKNNTNSERSMYIWNSNTNFSEEDNNFFIKNNIKNIYIRFFDVDFDVFNNEVPIAVQQFTGNISSEINIIPVVYIKNEVLKNIKTEALNNFAKKLHHKIYKIYIDNFSSHEINEVQFDCDWSETTKEKYFILLNFLKTKFGATKISVTIRLHQIKYKKDTGIPPADKGVLMYYNMGDFKNETEINSILNNKIGRKYINESSDYPIDISLALPIYSWAVWFKWKFNGEYYKKTFHKLLYSINSVNVDSLNFLQVEDKNMYQILCDTVYEGNYFRKGEKIKIEQIILHELTKAKKISKKLVNNEIILFSYSPDNSAFFNKDSLDKIYEIK